MSAEDINPQKSSPSDAKALQTLRLGVWELIVEQRPVIDLSFLPSPETIKNAVKDLQHVWTFSREIYRLGPRYFAFLLLCRVFDSVQSSFSLYFDGLLMDAVSGTLALGILD